MEITTFAKTNFRNREQVFGIKTDDRRRHMYIIGKTGMGKTNLIQNMAIQDIRNGKGVAIVDPHGEFAEECLKAVPKERINDVIYFNPADTEFPIALNVMEKVSPDQRHLVSSGLVGVFKKIWADSWGPRLEYLLRNAILALLEYPNSTLLGVTRILIDKEYRAKVMTKVTDPVVRSFWVDEFSKYQDRLMAEAIAPIQNKVGQFLSSSLIRNIIGQTKSSFSFREVMDGQKILIMNLSKGRIGEDNSALLGAMMITKIQLAAMGRVDIPKEKRKDFYLYVDEFQNFATESFDSILSEARKYRLNLILAHQYISQLNERVQGAIFGNVGTIVAFRIGSLDAEILEKEFEPTFTAIDLVNLAKYNIYLKLMVDGVATNPFSATTLPPIEIETTQENREKIIRNTRERYGSKKAEVEEKISRWSGIVTEEVKNKMEHLVKKSLVSKIEKIEKKIGPKETDSIKQGNSSLNTETVVLATKECLSKVSNKRLPKTIEEDQRKFFDADCSVCGIAIKVPFQPDGERPVFCKNCMKEYRRQQAKLLGQIKKEEITPVKSVNLASNFSQPKIKKNEEIKQFSYVGAGVKIKQRQVSEKNKESLSDLIKRALAEREKNQIKENN